MAPQRRAYIVRVHTPRQSLPAVTPVHDPHGIDSQQHGGMDRAAVNIAAENHLAARSGKRREHSLYGERTAACRQRRVTRAEKLCRPYLRLPDASLAFKERIGVGQLRQVESGTEGEKAAVSLVAGGVEGGAGPFRVAQQRLTEGRVLVIGRAVKFHKATPSESARSKAADVSPRTLIRPAL